MEPKLVQKKYEILRQEMCIRDRSCTGPPPSGTPKGEKLCYASFSPSSVPSISSSSGSGAASASIIPLGRVITVSYTHLISGVSLETLFKIAQVLKISPSKLLEDD